MRHPALSAASSESHGYAGETYQFDQLPSDKMVREWVRPFTEQHLTAHLPFDGCRFCGSPCRFIEFIEPQTREPELHEQFRKALYAFEGRPSADDWPENW